MGRYLLVAHQTADSPELRSRVLELVREDRTAEFVLLVPATPIGVLSSVGGEQRTAVELARSRAAQGRAMLSQAGAKVAAARIGNYDPMVAAGEELRGGGYDAVVISTLPPGVSRWLGQDLPARVARRFPGVRMIHVIAGQAAASAG